MRREELQHFGEAAGGKAVVAADARTLFEMNGFGEAAGGKQFVRDLKRLLEADGTAQALRADLQEDLVGDVVVRCAEQLDEDLRKLCSTGDCRPASSPSGTGPIETPFMLPPARLMNAAINSPAYCRLMLGSWLRLIRPVPLRPRNRNWLIASGVIGVCGSAERTLLPLRTA